MDIKDWLSWLLHAFCHLSLGSLHELISVQFVINIVIFATVTSHVYNSEGMELGQYFSNISIKDWLS